MENRAAKPNSKNSQEYPPSLTYCSLLTAASLRPIGRYLEFSLQNSPYLKKARAIKLEVENLALIGPIKVSGKLPTYPSSKPILTLPLYLGQKISLGDGCSQFSILSYPPVDIKLNFKNLHFSSVWRGNHLFT